MKRSALACLLCSVAMAGCGGTQTPRQSIQDPGELLYNGYAKADVDCYSCHNGDGSGTLKAPDLAETVPGMSDDELVKVILEGPSIMPSYRDTLSDAEIRQIVAWLRRRFGPPKT